MSSIDSFDHLSTEEVDPAAEFIAREQNLLAELDDEKPQVDASNLFTATTKPTSPLDEVDSLLNGSALDPVVSNSELPTLLEDDILIDSEHKTISSPVLDFEEPAKTSPVSLLENDLISDFVPQETPEQFDTLFTANNISPSNELTQSNSSLCNGNSPNNSLSYTSSSASMADRLEPEIVTHWRQEQRRRLEEKDAREEEANLKLRDQAKSELDEWYESYNRILEKRKQDNRDAEEKFLQDRDFPGEDWAKVASYCDFANKSSQGRDLSRMRAVLLQRKQYDKTKSTKSDQNLVNEL